MISLLEKKLDCPFEVEDKADILTIRIDKIYLLDVMKFLKNNDKSTRRTY